MNGRPPFLTVTSTNMVTAAALNQTYRQRPMFILTATATTAFFLALSALAEPLAKKLHLPVPTVLLLTGIGLALLARGSESLDVLPALLPAEHSLESLARLPVSSDVFLTVLLPILLFSGSVGMDLRHLMKDSAAIVLLAILAVLISIGVIGVTMHVSSGFGLTISLILATIISTTDPSAVLSLFRDHGVPGRLSRLIEGESLLNDATAIAAFTTLMDALASGHTPSGRTLVLLLISGLVGGLVIGVISGLALARALRSLSGYRSAQLTITLAAPYLIYSMAKFTPLISGVVAVVTTGVVFGVVGRSRFDPSDFSFLRRLLDQFAQWSSGLIFLLAGLVIPKILPGISHHELALSVVVTAAALAARAVTLGLFAPGLAWLQLIQKIPARYSAVLFWGGLRGAMTLALLLSLSQTAVLPQTVKHTLIAVAAIFTLFTLTIQGVTLRPLMKFLGIGMLNEIEQTLRAQALLEAFKATRNHAQQFSKRAGLDPSVPQKVLRPHEDRIQDDLARLGFETSVPDKEKLRFALDALISQEKSLLIAQKWTSGLPVAVVDQYLYGLDVMRDAAREQGRSGYLAAARRPFRHTWRGKLLSWLHSSGGVERPFANYVSQRFHLILVNRMLIRQLFSHSDNHLSAIFGERISRILDETLNRRLENVEQQISAIQLQYADFTKSLERTMVERFTYADAEHQVRSLLDNGTIPQGIAASLLDEIGQHATRSVVAPRIDFERPAPELLRLNSFFHALDEQELVRVAKPMKSIFLREGVTIVPKRDRAEAIYFIANGTVEAQAENGGKRRLGRGEAFGHLKAVSEMLSDTRVKTLTPTHCFLLKVADYRRVRASDRAEDASSAPQGGVA